MNTLTCTGADELQHQGPPGDDPRATWQEVPEEADGMLYQRADKINPKNQQVEKAA